jgi:2-isopropylmalate synthase
MKWREEKNCDHWTVPYLPLDPTDVGRVYEADVIRINSQSGKGGIGYILETKYGYNLPKKMRETFGYIVKGVSDHEHRELMPDEVFDIFKKNFIDIDSPVKILETHFIQQNGIEATVTLEYNGKKAVAGDSGNGRLDAVSNAVRSYIGKNYSINTYTQHSLEVGSSSHAVTYVEIIDENGKSFWGTGIDTDITNSSVKALASAINNSFR